MAGFFIEPRNIEKLTRNVAVSLIREVRVMDKNSIEITFDFDDCYRECMDNLDRKDSSDDIIIPFKNSRRVRFISFPPCSTRCWRCLIFSPGNERMETGGDCMG